MGETTSIQFSVVFSCIISSNLTVCLKTVSSHVLRICLASLYTFVRVFYMHIPWRYSGEAASCSFTHSSLLFYRRSVLLLHSFSCMSLHIVPMQQLFAVFFLLVMKSSHILLDISS